ncbi:HRDC domain-containing protein [Bacillus solitudinis]|uniref:HRDC domain-containing protein n=1 Tax=Bacillus solitudinis TaxID=2014074 RepID=UPI000C24C1D0|nr:HRDC domain-containing protein [Bacillus solitudinis]
MSFLKKVFNILSDSREIKKPIMIKEFNDKSNQIEQLSNLLETNNPQIDSKKVQNHLKLFSIGQTGEKSVLFELQNSMLPMLILHDVYLKYENYEAQMDYVLVTHKFILVLEVKKLFGNIHVTEKGEFQRVITKNNRVINKEGMYSPINQVERHVAILENFLKTRGLITKCPIRYAVTFANPKTIIDISKNAPTSIHSNVIRHDQIRSLLEKELKKDSPVFMPDAPVYQIADALMQYSTEKSFNPDQYLLNEPEALPKAVTNESTPTEPQDNQRLNNFDESLKAELIQFRSKRSKELTIKPYHVFTNKILDDILEKKPSTAEELLQIEGIGPKKIEEFGHDILAIILNKRNIESQPDLVKEQSAPLHISPPVAEVNVTSTDKLKVSLTEYRTKYSRKLGVKPFYIFTNKTLEALLEKKPKTIEDLLKIDGFGPKKVEEFGQDIVLLINKAI